VDNGWPWGSGGDLPPVLSLWLLGLGIQVVWNRPARPQENGVVERFNGLLTSWGEPERCGSWQAWTQSVARVVQVQREIYPAVKGQSRMKAHPELLQNPRLFREDEEGSWRIERVRQYLGGGFWKRLVNKQGQITLYRRPYTVGRAWAGRTVFVRLDAKTNDWVVRDPEGEELKRHPARELSAERIWALDINYVKPNERRKREQRPNPPAFYAT
jgi:hypothetical protein